MSTPEQFDGITAGSVKAAQKNAGATALSGAVMVPIAEIEIVPGFNVRNTKGQAYKDRVRYLADSIKTNGFKSDKPLEGYVGKKDGVDKFFLTGGHTRMDGVKLAISEGAELTMLPMVVKPAGTTVEDLTADLVINNEGQPLEPIEVAEVCKRLVAFGWTPEQIAERLSKTVVYVNKLLSLAAAPAAIRTMVAKGQVAASLAVEVLEKKPAKAVEILKAAVAKSEAKGAQAPAKAPKAGTKGAKTAAKKAAKKKVGKVTRKDLAGDVMKADAVLTALSTEHSGVEGEPEYVVLTLRMKSTEALAALATETALKITLKVESDDEL